MTSALFLGVAVLVLSGATYKAVGVWTQPSRPAWAFTVALYALGVAHVLRAPVVAQPVNRAVRVPNLNVLAGNALTLIAACCVLVVLVYFTDPAGRRSRRRSRLWITLLLAVLTAMTGLFVWSLASPPADFLEHRSAQSLAYVLIYVTYLAAAVTEACQLSVRYTRHTADQYLRVGLQMVALGSAIGLLYCFIYAYNTLAPRTQLAPLAPGVVTSAVLPVTCCALLVIGSTIGGWGPRLREWFADYRSYRKLGPLWRALAEVAPEAIPPPDMASLTIGQKRYRRVIEIRDMILTLRAYRDSALTTAPAAAGESSLVASAATEATVIASAIRARREGRPTTGGADIAMPPQLGTNLATESRWLEAVSTAFTTVTEEGPRGLH